MDSEYKCPVSRKTSCDLLPFSVPVGAFNPGRNLTDGRVLAFILIRVDGRVIGFILIKAKSITNPALGCGILIKMHPCIHDITIQIEHEP